MTDQEAAALREALRILQERNTRLEAALRPFGEAMKLHCAYIDQPRKFKERITFDLGLMDWQKVADVLGIDLTAKTPQMTEEVRQ